MITLKLTHGLSHSNGFVSATQRNPYVEVEDEAVAKYCIDSGFFARVGGKIVSESAPAAPAAPATTSAPSDETGTSNTANDGENAAPAAPADDSDELESMTVNELKAYAETVGIDLGKATRKADIIAIIREEEAEA